jgi:cobalt-zinc-cadmium efflux system membrane fusion protein
MNMNRNPAIRGLSVIVTTVVLPLLVGCGHTDLHGTAAAQERQSESPIRYVEVKQQAVPDTLELAAKVQADPTKVVHIFPPASGRVVSIAVKPGDRVTQGETLAVISSSDVASARSDFAKAKIEAERGSRAAERERLLFEHGATAEKDYIDAAAQAESDRAELVRAQQRLDLLNISPTSDSDHVSLTSPARGVVLDVSAAPGEFSKSLESANSLITIADLDTVWVVGDLYEKDAAKLSSGKPVTVSLQAYDDREWTSHIDSISGALDPATRTLKVRVTLPNPNQLLKPEMFGSIRVNVGTHRALVIPVAAVIHEGNATTVFARNGAAPEQRPVTLGQIVDGSVEVLSGLRAGDQVAAQGAELLKGGPDE